jgi:hypothetical protein
MRYLRICKLLFNFMTFACLHSILQRRAANLKLSSPIKYFLRHHPTTSECVSAPEDILLCKILAT